ncbi:50S ribosomal protein L10 [Limnochorda pilosa]|uniref:Large ribosomal subunit protein uL10 n=1 Tax=Limnochorda pilosa TaxID=1555112 RepID=A0A0K2SQK4_LIMPI|nr:50S ribosomal protein L10 [Limnochorda pilosa]BAS29099.1 50S ribosomal protein L10 [Limnochorda pilosa]
MPRPEKVAQVVDLTDRMRRSQAVLAADYRGLSVKAMGQLRSQMRQAGVDVKVVKNTLARRASDEAQVPELKAFLDGPTVLAFAYADPVAPAKVLDSFARQHQELQVKGGVLNGARVDAAGVTRLATLPGREELLAQVLRALQGPMSGLVYVLSGVPRKLVYALDALRREREAG